MKESLFYKNAFFVSLFLFLTTLTILLSDFARKSEAASAQNQQAGGMGFKHFRNNLGFDSSQSRLYDSLLADYQMQTTALREALQVEQDQLFQILSEGAADSLALSGISLKASKLQHEIRMATFRHLQKVNRLADPDQKVQLLRLYKNLMNENKATDNTKGNGRNRYRHGQRSQ